MNRQYTHLELEHGGHVATVHLAREAVRNAFNETMIAELDACFTALASDGSVRAIVLAARGPAFCAGADLDWMARMARYSAEENRADALKLAHMLRAIQRCPKPVIARVHGDAYAGGIGLLCACDIAIASRTASFGLSETRLGLVPGTIAPYVVRAIGQRQTQRYALTGERFDAAEALRIGLVHALADAERMDEAIAPILDAFALTSPDAVARAKRLLHDIYGRPLDDALIADTAAAIAAARGSEDGREGVSAFLQKRKPRWQA